MCMNIVIVLQSTINMETNVRLPLPLAQHTNSQLLERLAGTTRNTRKYVDLHGMGRCVTLLMFIPNMAAPAPMNA